MTRWLKAAREGVSHSLPPHKRQKDENANNAGNDATGEASSRPVDSGTFGAFGIFGILSPDAESIALDHFEERAAIREEAGQPRAEAEAAALEEAARAAGVSTDALRLAWAGEADARALMGWLRACGGGSVSEAARVLVWGDGRSWAAAMRLRAAGLVRLGADGSIAPRRGDFHASG